MALVLAKTKGVQKVWACIVYDQGWKPLTGTIELEGEPESRVSAYLEFDTIGLETEDIAGIEKETYFRQQRSMVEISFPKREKEIFKINFRSMEQPGSCRQNVHKSSNCRNASVYINPKA